MAQDMGGASKRNDRLSQLEVGSWSENDVGDWLHVLSEEQDWSEASSVLREASGKARSMRVSGDILQKMSVDAWEDLGIKSRLLQARLANRLSGDAIDMSHTSVRTTKGIRLGVTINVTAVSAISLVDQTFDCRFVLRCRTLNIASEENKDAPIRTLLGEPITTDNWEPRIHFLNLREARNWRFHAQLTKDGEIEFKYTIEGAFSEPYELKSFPFDVQALTLKMTSSIPCEVMQGSGPPKEILSFSELPSATSVVQVSNFGASNTYELSSRVKCTPGKTSAKQSTTGTVRPTFYMKMKVKRMASTYMWNFILPLFLIVLMTFSAWGIEVGEVGERLSVSLTMVLTAIAMKLQVSDKLPTIYYTTFIDQYVTASFFCIFCVVAQNALIGLVEDEEERQTLDGICFQTMLGAFLLGNFFFMLYAAWIRRQMNFKLNAQFAETSASGQLSGSEYVALTGHGCFS